MSDSDGEPEIVAIGQNQVVIETKREPNEQQQHKQHKHNKQFLGINKKNINDKSERTKMTLDKDVVVEFGD